MENIQISQSENGIGIEGFPDAVKVIALKGKVPKRLADLALHKADLEFARDSLHAINQTEGMPEIVRESLWRSSIVHYFKCFGNGSRFQLSAKKVYKKEPEEALEVFAYFKSLRNKHFVHDENSYAQSLPGAILNNGSKPYKIEKIICSSFVGQTLVNDNFGNMDLLIKKAQEWVVSEFDKLCHDLTKELEAKSYQELLDYDQLMCQVPSIDEIDNARKQP